MTREEKRKKLQLDLDDLRAFEGNEAKIKRIEKKLEELDLLDELQILENKKLHHFIDSKGMTAEWNRYVDKED